MAGIFGDEINNRADFFKQLARAKKLVTSVLKRLPDESPLKGVIRQIDAIEKWTAKGRTPTREERKSIDMGYRMIREYEGTDDDEIYDLREVVMGVANYFECWPTDKLAADPNNDDFYYSEDNVDED